MDSASNNTLIETVWENTVTKNLKIISEFQKQGLFCDLTLRSKDGLEFKVHKLLICSVSGFFKDLFTGDFKDSSENIIQLDVSTGAILEKVLSFVYEGILEIKNAEDCIKIANLANYLQFKELYEYCCSRLGEFLNDSLCLQCWRLCREYLVKCGEDLCLLYIVNSAERLFQDPSFVNDLKATEMKILLEDERLNCDPKIVFKKVEQWAENNTENFSDVVEHLKFSSLDEDFLLANVLENEILMEDKKVLRNFAECIKYKWKENMDLLENSKLSSGWKKNFLTITGTNILGISTSGEKMEKFHENCYLAKHFGYTTFGINFLLACGGLNDSSRAQNTCKYFSPATKEWTVIQSMRLARYSHRCEYMDGKIYACGGIVNGDSSSSVEIFDKNTGSWLNGPSMMYGKDSFGLTSLNGSLYAVGKSTIENLDPRGSNKWEFFANNIYNIPCYRCVSIGYKIYCFDQNKQFFIFDTRTKCCELWESASLNSLYQEDLESLHVCEIDGEIGVFSPKRCSFLKLNLKGEIISRCTLSDVPQSANGNSALVAMYY